MKVNIYLLLFFLIFGVNQVFSQEVLLDKALSVSGFMSISPSVSDFNGNFAFSQGASAAAIFNQKFYVGFFAESLWTSKDHGLFQNNDCCEPAFGAAGLMVGSIIQPEKLIHFDIRTEIGLGALRIGDASQQVILFDDFESDYEPVFVVQPSAGVEINITKFFKINTHVGYRYVGYVDDVSYEVNSLNGITGQIGLVFGWFGKKKDRMPDIVPPDAETIRL